MIYHLVMDQRQGSRREERKPDTTIRAGQNDWNGCIQRTLVVSRLMKT